MTLTVHGSGLNWTLLPVDDPNQPEYGVWYDWVMENKKLSESDPAGNRVIAPVGDYFVRPQMEGEGFELTIERAFARPQDRWIDLFVETERDFLAADDVHYHVRLFPFGHSSPVAQEKFRPDGRVGLLQVDLRRHDLQNARLSISLLANGKRVGMAEVALSAQALAHPIREGERIAIDVDAPKGHSQDDWYPITFGVPFPAGSLWDGDGLRLVDGQGNEIPSQSEVIALWSPDGSVKWVRFDALAQPKAGLFVEIGKSSSSFSNRHSLRLTEETDRVVIDIGAAQYVLAKGPSPIQEIKLDGKTVATGERARGLYVVDQRGRVGIAAADEESMVVESRGPLAASVRFEGFYRTEDGEDLARHITRIEAFAGQSAVKVTHTLILTNDTNDVWFKDIGWELTVDPGVNPEAIFGNSRNEPHQFVRQSLDQDTPTAYIIQESHFRFGAGTNVYKIAGVDKQGQETPLATGEEMGDWTALVGDQGGLIASVREAARQHPKEFEVESDRIVIRLFSNRAGEELDFRFDTLADRWNLDEVKPEDRSHLESTNAIGWSKSHELLLSPLPAESDGNAAAQISLLNSRPIHAHVDPRWIYESKAMGSLHPKDTEHYPEAESLIDDHVERWKDLALDGPGFFGFVDYYSGPSFAGGMGRRYRLTYTLRGDLWGVYARSGERWVREFAEGTNRAYMDNHLVHWPGPNKTKGLYLVAANSRTGLGRKGDLPFYWEERTDVELRSSTNLNQFIYDYYLTGNRRAKDIVEQFAQGLKQEWTPESLRRNNRVIMHFRTLTQSYAFTWEPRLRALAQATAAYFYDPESVTSLTKDRPGHSATYKANSDIRALLEGWNIYGTIPYYDMCRRTSDHLISMGVGLKPDGYTFPLAIAGEFLYEETGDPLIPQVLERYVEWATKMDHEARWRRVSALGTFLTEGIAVAQSVLKASEKDTSKSEAFWLSYDDDNGKYQVSIVTRKGVYDMVDIDVHPAALGEYVPSDTPIAQGGAKVTPLEENIHQGIDLIGISTTLGMRNIDHAGFGSTRISIPREAPGEQYQIHPLATGAKFVVGRLREPKLTRVSEHYDRPYEHSVDIPLVIHAPSGWMLPRIPVRVYFRVPENVSNMQIFFGDDVRLYGPEGESVNNGAPVYGWYDLPVDQPGLWSFEPTTVMTPVLVEVRNIPPFFTMNDPNRYFEPLIPWIEWLQGPKFDATVRGQVPVELKVHKPSELDVEQINLCVGDTLIYQGSGASHSFVLDTRKFADGKHTIKSHVQAGKALVELEIPVNVDNK